MLLLVVQLSVIHYILCMLQAYTRVLGFVDGELAVS